MTSLSQAIIHSLHYAAIFNSGLSEKDLFLYLHASKQYPFSAMQAELHKLLSQQQVHVYQQLYYLPELESEKHNLVNKRRQAEQKMKLALRFRPYFSKVPGIRAVFISGSVAARNANTQDDIDMCIVCERGMLWQSRLALLLKLLKVSQLRTGFSSSVKDLFCLNMWLDTSSFAIPQPSQNLYTAHELIQLYPVYDPDNVYQQLLQANNWVARYLAHAAPESTPQTASTATSFASIKTQLLEQVAYIFQRIYMFPKQKRERVTRSRAFFHPRNTAQTVLHSYRNRIQTIR